MSLLPIPSDERTMQTRSMPTRFMTTTTSSRECPICLDKFRDPVVTPCGHLACHPCIKTHARGSNDPYEATCPTCRTPFPIVAPDMSIVPKKYHVFISPPLRRVFLGDSDDSSREVIEKLNAEVAVLKARVGSLKRDKDLLMDRCEAAQCALTRLTSDERAARLARDEAKELVRVAKLIIKKAREDARVAKHTLRELQMENDTRNCRCAGEQSSRLVTKAKRTSGHAELDDSIHASDSGDSDSPGSPRSTAQINFLDGVRHIKPMPKRARLRPACAVSPEPNVQQSSSNATSSIPFCDSSSSGYSSPPGPVLRSSVRLARRRDLGMSRNVRDVRYGVNSSGDEADDHDERSDMEDIHATRLFSSLIRDTQEAPPPPSIFLRVPRRSVNPRMVPVTRE